ncbi:hypothetical protein CT676_13285 [Bradyrhizobium sp. MOS001]|nr:hypothetical protein CT676_13285 [Bradyrhizobium sp. MOS001]
MWSRRSLGGAGTGASSTPRPIEESQPSLEYWIARSSRAMTAENVASTDAMARCPTPSRPPLPRSASSPADRTPTPASPSTRGDHSP